MNELPDISKLKINTQFSIIKLESEINNINDIDKLREFCKVVYREFRIRDEILTKMYGDLLLRGITEEIE